MSSKKFDTGDVVIIQNVRFCFDGETAVVEEDCGNGNYLVKL